MDPLAALRLEISKKRKAIASSTSARPAKPEGVAATPTVRWVSQAEIERQREREYQQRENLSKHRTQRPLKRQRSSASDYHLEPNHIPDKRPGITSPAVSSNLKSFPSSANTPGTAQEKSRELVHESNPPENQPSSPPLGVRDVKRRLRTMKQPVTLFGEDDWDRFRRLRQLQLSREDPSDGQNLYQKKMREVKAKHAEEDVYDYAGATLPNHVRHYTSEDKKKYKDKYNGGDNDTSKPACNEDFVYGAIMKYLRLWQSDIDALSKEECRTKLGRSQLVTYEQTKQWLQPLESLLRKRKLSRPILDALRDIFDATARREYVFAMRLYLERLAIGNAPWPMGATQVGIHSRAAREKIGEDKIAHVMNDEITRKYIQAVKRLLTVAQRHYPTQISKMVST